MASDMGGVTGAQTPSVAEDGESPHSAPGVRITQAEPHSHDSWHGRLPGSLLRNLGVQPARRSLAGGGTGRGRRASLPHSAFMLLDASQDGSPVRPEDCDYCEMGEEELPCICGRRLCRICRGVELGVCSCGQELYP